MTVQVRDDGTVLTWMTAAMTPATPEDAVLLKVLRPDGEICLLRPLALVRAVCSVCGCDPRIACVRCAAGRCPFCGKR